MANGKEYEARRAILKDEKGTDRSVLIVHTGDDTGKFKEGQIADQPNTGKALELVSRKIQPRPT